MSGSITTLGRETVFNGTIEFTDELAIAGTFCGTVRATGNLKVLKGANCKFDTIEINSAIIDGAVGGLIKSNSAQNASSDANIHSKQKQGKGGAATPTDAKDELFDDEGAVLAQIMATDKVELLSDARVEALITTGKIRIEDGAQFVGSVTMKNAPDNDTFATASKEFQGAFVPLQKSIG